jgi:hypothetical protein
VRSCIQAAVTRTCNSSPLVTLVCFVAVRVLLGTQQSEVRGAWRAASKSGGRLRARARHLSSIWLGRQICWDSIVPECRRGSLVNDLGPKGFCRAPLASPRTQGGKGGFDTSQVVFFEFPPARPSSWISVSDVSRRRSVLCHRGRCMITGTCCPMHANFRRSAQGPAGIRPG